MFQHFLHPTSRCVVINVQYFMHLTVTDYVDICSTVFAARLAPRFAGRRPANLRKQHHKELFGGIVCAHCLNMCCLFADFAYFMLNVEFSVVACSIARMRRWRATLHCAGRLSYVLFVFVFGVLARFTIISPEFMQSHQNFTGFLSNRSTLNKGINHNSAFPHCTTLQSGGIRLPGLPARAAPSFAGWSAACSGAGARRAPAVILYCTIWNN